MSTTTIKKNGSRYSWSSIKKSPQDNFSFSADDILNAYSKGCDVGFATTIENMQKDLKKKLDNSLSIMQKFYDSINREDITCKTMFLRIQDLNKFDFIIAIDEDAYYDDNISRPIYEDSFKLIKEFKNINITFMPYTDDLNYESLKSDKFIASYGKSK